jgi:diguanylate cyclase (GGDEF)-like protein
VLPWSIFADRRAWDALKKSDGAAVIDIDELLKAERLPSLPHVVARLLRRGRDPEPPTRALDLIVRADPAAAARALKFANSTYFGRKWPMMSVDHASPLLGTTVVRSLALTLALRPASLGTSAVAGAFYDYWRQSITQAAAAARLGTCVGKGSDADLYFAGLLLDLGRLVLLDASPQEYADAADQSRRAGTPLSTVEREWFGIDHAELGARLMERWNFPAALVEATRLHHQPAAERDESQHEGTVMPLTVAAAVDEFLLDEQQRDAWPRLQHLFETTWRGTDLDLHELIAQTRRARADLEAEVSCDPENIPSIAELYSAANAELAELVVSESIATTQAQARAEAAREHAVQVTRRIEELEQQALRDPLTRIYNRQFFEESLLQEAARCCRHSLPIGLVFIDVDRFKQVNDTWGHAFGDRVLTQIAHTIQNTVRANDILARFGGEEFVVLPGHPTEAGLARLAERIRTAVGELEHEVDDQRISITASIGYTLALPTRHETDLPARLVAAADAAMYEAKHLGRNRTSFQSLMNEKDRQFMRRLVEWCFSRWLVRRGVLSGTAVNNILIDYQADRQPIGRLAIQEGLLTDADVSRIIREQQRQQERFGAVATRLGLLTEDQLLRLMALQREDPVQIARIAIGHGLLDDARAVLLVAEYTAELRDSDRSTPDVDDEAAAPLERPTSGRTGTQPEVALPPAVDTRAAPDVTAPART